MSASTTNKKRKALGRGLDKLIPVEDPATVDSTPGVMEVEITAIRVNPFQPRIDFDDSEIHNLAESIKNQGLLQPIVLRKKNDFYELISGERRFRAFRHLGRSVIPAIIKYDISDVEMLEMALVENIQRENLNDVEVALSYQKLLFDCGLSHQQLSERVGKSRSGITNTLRLLKLPSVIQHYLREGKISSGHGRALLAIDGEERQLEICERILAEGLSVREIENIASGNNSHESPVKKEKKPSRIPVVKETDPDIADVEQKMRYHFGTDVKIAVDSTSYKGKLEIHCYSKDDLDRVISLILHQ